MSDYHELLAMPEVEAVLVLTPIALNETVALDALVAEGYASSLVEAAIRFVMSKPQVATTLVGISSIEQFDQALAAVNQGALPAEASARLQSIWQVI